jgi:hypothetical protein
MPQIFRSTTWLVGEDPPQTLRKHPNDSRQFTFDFSDVLEPGESFNSPAPTVILTLLGNASASIATHRLDWQTLDLTVGLPTIVPATQQVQFSLSGGQDGVTYELTCSVTTTNGSVVEGTGRLLVSRKAP